MWRARQACQLRCIANGAGRLSNPAIAPSKLDQGFGINSEVFLGCPQPHKHHSKPKSKAGPYKLHPKFPKILFSPGRLRIYCRPGKTEIWRDNGEQAAKMGAEVSLCSCDEERELRRRPKQTEATNLTPRHYTGPRFFFFTSALRAWAMAIWDVRAGALSA